MNPQLVSSTVAGIIGAPYRKGGPRICRHFGNAIVSNMRIEGVVSGLHV